jgi:hypothetical protein
MRESGTAVMTAAVYSTALFVTVHIKLKMRRSVNGSLIKQIINGNRKGDGMNK